MSKKKFTTEQARGLCESLEAHGWVVFDNDEKARCVGCAEPQSVDWSFCPYCGNNNEENPCEQDSEAIQSTIELVRELVEEAMT